jgi:hypothetical protein
MGSFDELIDACRAAVRDPYHCGIDRVELRDRDDFDRLSEHFPAHPLDGEPTVRDRWLYLRGVPLLLFGIPIYLDPDIPVGVAVLGYRDGRAPKFFALS